MENLNSSINNVGEIVTQIIHFVNGTKRTFRGIISQSTIQGQFTKMIRRDGSMLMINDKNVLCIEVYLEKNEEEGSK
jgi:hypothetical protein